MEKQTYFQFIQYIRDFFLEHGFIDVITPPLVSNPGFETHIHPFSIKSYRQNTDLPMFLHTSPEFHMKELLAEGMEKIFNLSYCFRDEPISPVHRQQFLMLEWYRSNKQYEVIMDDCIKLTTFLIEKLQKTHINLNYHSSSLMIEKITVQDLFLEYLKFDILQFLDKNEIKALVSKDYPELISSNENDLSWDDYFFLLFLNKIEPLLKHREFLILYEYPNPLAALSTLKKSDPRVCERFEIYMRGIEICNCFNELVDLEEQKKRYYRQKEDKFKIYNYDLPEPKILFDALKKGLPNSSGIAMGVERLLMVLTGDPNPFYK